ncbi:MAG TPA: hypothetical protein VGF95_10545 [Solirubrobacteraceae bacterium]|jgi:hypothetical protein
MVMVGQHQRLKEPLGWTRGGKIALAALGAIVVAGVVALVVALASGSSAPRPGCISVTFASTVGGATVQDCGQKARVACESPQQSSFSGDLPALRSACRQAGLPFAS